MNDIVPPFVNLAVFASGNGSNAVALIRAAQSGILAAKIVVLICDRPAAPVIEKAAALAVPVHVLPREEYADKAAHEQAILNILRQHKTDFIALAGYMRLLGTVLLRAFPQKIVNIHPSLLPKYKGLNAIEQAVSQGDPELGVTIHYVDAGMDSGEIIAQQKVYIADLSQPLTAIEAQIHRIEHELYIQTLQKIFSTFSHSSSQL